MNCTFDRSFTCRKFPIRRALSPTESLTVFEILFLLSVQCISSIIHIIKSTYYSKIHLAQLDVSISETFIRISWYLVLGIMVLYTFAYIYPITCIKTPFAPLSF